MIDLRHTPDRFIINLVTSSGSSVLSVAWWLFSWIFDVHIKYQLMATEQFTDFKSLSAFVVYKCTSQNLGGYFCGKVLLADT